MPKGRVVANNDHESQVLLTCMNAVGYTGGALGKVTKELALLK